MIRFRGYSIVVAVASLVFLTNLGGATLFDEDEPKNAVCGREMFLRGDWVVPTFNQDLRTDKPILIYWVMQASFHLFGVSEFSARLGSAVLSICSALMAWQIGRKLFDEAVGVLAGVILATCLMFAAVGRAVTPDAFLVSTVTLAMTWFVTAVATRQQGCFRPGNWRECVPPSWMTGLGVFVAMGLAVLAKGPVGIILPVGILGFFLLWQRQADEDLTVQQQPFRWLSVHSWRVAVGSFATCFVNPRRIVDAAIQLRLLTGILIALAVAAPWYIAVSLATDGAWLRGFLGNHNVGRFLQSMENHRGPFFYYVPVLAMGLFPWSILVPVALRNAWLRLNTDEGPALRFLLSWVGVWLIFFSMASTKLPNYVLPIYPPVAILASRYLWAWVRESSPESARLMRWGGIVLGTAGAVMCVGLGIATVILLPEISWLATLGLIPIIGAGVVIRSTLDKDRSRMPFVWGSVGTILAVAGIALAPTFISRFQDSPLIAGYIGRVVPGRPVQVGTFEYSSPSLVFYAGPRVEPLFLPSDVAKFLLNPDHIAVIRSDKMDQLKESLPPGAEEIGRVRRFLRRHDLVLLRCPQQIALDDKQSPK